MNKLAMPLLVLGSLFMASGCIITSDSGGGGGAGGVFSVSWEVSDGCPAGAAAHINSLPVGSTGQPFVDIYNCADGVGTTDPLALDDYQVWVEITDAGGSTLLAQSNSVNSSLVVDGDQVNVDIPAFLATQGFFGFTWSMTDGTNDLSCADVFADGVDVIATLAGTTDGTVDVFNCTDDGAVTDPLAVGQYTVVVDLLDGENALGTSMARDESIDFGNHLNDLGNFEFAFAP